MDDDPAEAPPRLEDLPGRDLSGWDLTKVEFKDLLPAHLAGTILTGAKLPEEIAKFLALDQVKEISADARKIFIGLLAACVYSWLVIGTTKDVALILNTASSPLPIINTPIPIAGFYVVGAALLAAVYCYFHFYLQRLWRTLATLPAVFPDGTPLDDKTDPWLLTNLVRADFKRLWRSAPPLVRLENALTILLAWWLVPLTLLALWARYLPAHYWLGTTWLVALIGITALFGRHTFRLARATLRGETPAAEAEGGDGGGVLRRAWHEFRHIRPDRLTVSLIAVLIVCSLSAFHDNPRDRYTWVAKGLNAVGLRTYADLREVNVAERPEGWDAKDRSKVRRVDLRGRNLAFADATRTFLVNSDLRGAHLTGAILESAELQGSDISYATLQGAAISWAELEDADLGNARLQGAELVEAQLHGANLRFAELQGALLWYAQLQGADLTGAQLHGADFSNAYLQGASLRSAELLATVFRQAQLQGADLRLARLQGADLFDADLRGADLRHSVFWHTMGPAAFYLADLRGSTIRGMVDAEIDEATKSISREDRRKAAVERLKGQGQKFTREYLDRTQETVEDYDDELARFLGELVCGRGVPEAQVRSLADRAIVTGGPVEGVAMKDHEPSRIWPQLLANRLIGPDCLPAKSLPDQLRRRLEELAARDKAAATPPEASPPDPIE